MSGRIDMHAHQLPQRFLAEVQRRGLTFPCGAITAEDHLRAMDQYGWELAVISLPPPGPGVGTGEDAIALARCGNDALAEVVAAHPDRFAALASLPLPDVDAALAELEHALDELQLDGVTLLSNTAGVYLGDRRLEPLLAALDARGAFVLLHPVDPPVTPCERFPTWLLEAPFETTRAVAALLYEGVFERYPRIVWQLAHAGGAVPSLAGRIASVRTRAPELAPGLTGDPLAQLASLYVDTAQASDVRALAATFALLDPSHVVHGTDWPFAVLAEGADPQPELDAVTRTSRRALDRENALGMAPSIARHLANAPRSSHGV